MKHKTLYKTLGILFVIVFSVYALSACIYLFCKGNIESMVNGGIVIFLWLIIFILPLLLLTGKLQKFFSKYTPVEKRGGDKTHQPSSLKSILPMFLIILAVSLGLLIYWAVLTARTANDDFIRCEGILTKYGCSFTDNFGVLHHVENSSSWGGVYFENGNKIIIYYEFLNPENVIYHSNNVMLFAVGWFFLMADLIMLSSAFKKFTSIVPIFVGLIFTVVSVCVQTGIALAGGLTFSDTVFSGATAYIMNVLLVLGLYTLIYGLVKTFKSRK